MIWWMLLMSCQRLTSTNNNTSCNNEYLLITNNRNFDYLTDVHIWSLQNILDCTLERFNIFVHFRDFEYLLSWEIWEYHWMWASRQCWAGQRCRGTPCGISGPGNIGLISWGWFGLRSKFCDRVSKDQGCPYIFPYVPFAVILETISNNESGLSVYFRPCRNIFDKKLS